MSAEFPVGLACRLCWLVSVLSHPQGVQGRHFHQTLHVIFLIFRAKVFYFIRPTPANLAAYERWSGTELQSNTWLGDMVDQVVKVTLHPGNTMIIPTGWIHAVVSLIPLVILHYYDEISSTRPWIRLCLGVTFCTRTTSARVSIWNAIPTSHTALLV